MKNNVIIALNKTLELISLGRRDSQILYIICLLENAYVFREKVKKYLTKKNYSTKRIGIIRNSK